MRTIIETEVIVMRPDGLHARPAGELIRRLQDFSSSVEIRFGDKKVNGKSIIQLMALAVKQGEVLTVTITGEDAPEALQAIEEFLGDARA
jgi:phosphotransferase system HPr (HPr) family protein